MDEKAVRNIGDLEPWLAELWDLRGTDLLLMAGAPPLIRVDQVIRPVTGGQALSADEADRIIHSVVGPDLVEDLVGDREVDFAFSWQDKARLRCNAYHQRESCALALRMIPYEIPLFHDLGIPQVVEKLVNRPMGLIIVTGPTGSGKSTSIAAMIDYINQRRPCHIVTIEDPVEYVHGNHRSAVSQREVGTDTLSFNRALRSVLREDPDVLLVGEMRDLESIATTLTIAETGHLVFATLHTNDWPRPSTASSTSSRPTAVTRVQVQLASVLEGVIYQRLLPRIGGGLVAAYEVLMANHAVRNLVREGKTRQLRNIISTHQSEGMQTMEMSLTSLVEQDVIDYEDALAISLHPKEVGKPPNVATAVPGNGEALPSTQLSNGARPGEPESEPPRVASV